MLLRFLLTVSLFLAGVAHAAAEEWSLARDRDGIKVWTREVPGHPIRAFKATMTVNSTLTSLLNLILDTESASRWVYRTNRIELLERDVDKATFVIRVETNFPWPLMNRDVIVAGSIEQDEVTKAVSVSSYSVRREEYPPAPGYIRMPNMEGNWTLRPVGDGRIEVTMLGRADPGGSIPAGIVNLIIHETPYNTLQGMRRLVNDPRYRKTPLPQIVEPRNK